MARALPGVRFAGMPRATVAADIERMSPVVLRLVLERRLAAVESRIRVLSDRLGAAEQRSGVLSEWKWSREPVTQGRWAFLADLSYCIAARDALQDAISAL